MTELRPAGPADLTAVYELLGRRSRALHGISEANLAQLRHRMGLASFNGWVATEGETALGFVSLDAAQEVALATDDPTLADALLALAEERARERGFDSLGLTTAREDALLSALARRGGFAHDRTILRMWRRLDGGVPDPCWPARVSVRAYEAADAPAVKGLLDEAYAGWDTRYTPRTLHDWVAFMTGHDEFDPALWFLAERNGRLVGCALTWGTHQRRGWLKDLAVRESERGSGLGTALLHHSLRAYDARTVESVGLKADASNPTGALRLYERAGFVTDRRYELWRRPL